MNIWKYLENNNLAGLAIISLEDILNAFKYYKYFVANHNFKDFDDKRKIFDDKYNEGLNIKVSKAIENYEEAIRNNDIPDEDPEIVKAKVNSEYRSNLISLIREYFDLEVFHRNKLYLPGFKLDKESNQADTRELAIALVPIRRNLYTFLSVVGYYQRTKHYFLSAQDWKNICYLYSKEVAFINQNLGYKFELLNPFIKDKRLDKKYIDVDKISLESLILTCLKTNIKQLVQIAKIIRECFDKASGDTWKEIQVQTDEYIKKCEIKNLMVRV